jgi:hypothetical protein
LSVCVCASVFSQGEKYTPCSVCRGKQRKMM